MSSICIIKWPSSFLLGVELDNGIYDALCLDDNRRVLVGLDDGSVEMFVLQSVEGETNGQPFLDKTISIQEHNDLVSGMAMTGKKGR